MLLFRLKVLSQITLNGFFCSWTESRCASKFPFCEQVKSQMSHLNSFLFSWTDSQCLFRLSIGVSELELGIGVEAAFAETLFLLASWEGPAIGVLPCFLFTGLLSRRYFLFTLSAVWAATDLAFGVSSLFPLQWFFASFYPFFSSHMSWTSSSVWVWSLGWDHFGTSVK